MRPPTSPRPRCEAALAEIVQLIAENKFEPNYLVGMINEIAKNGPTQVGAAVMSNNEISDEAKKTRKNTKLAQTRKRNAAHRLRQRRKTPLGRLHTDGSCRSENLGRRLQWLAHEWQIPEKQLPKATSCPTDELLDFAEKYHFRLGWLLGGDLKELRDMMRAHKLARGVSIAGRFKEKCACLTPEQRRIVEEEVERLLEEQRSEAPAPIA
jgi:hypothetical protein